MPLDDPGRRFVLDDVRVGDPLARLGIMPIPYDQVQRYKDRYKAVWLERGKDRGRQGPFEWRTVSFFDWMEQQKLHEFWHPNKAHKPITLEDFLAAPMKFNKRTSDATPAPQALVDLATVVERNVEEAHFSVDYFDTDPVLNVRYGRGLHSACLGIWDGGKVVAIADHEFGASIELAPPTGFLGRLRRRLFSGGLWGR